MESGSQHTKPHALTRSEVLAILSDHKQDLADKYGVTRLGIFGSVARAENSEASDVDVIAEMPANYSQMVRLKEELELLLQTQVDLVRYQRNLSEFFRKRLDQEAIYV